MRCYDNVLAASLTVHCIIVFAITSWTHDYHCSLPAAWLCAFDCEARVPQFYAGAFHFVKTLDGEQSRSPHLAVFAGVNVNVRETRPTAMETQSNGAKCWSICACQQCCFWRHQALSWICIGVWPVLGSVFKPCGLHCHRSRHWCQRGNRYVFAVAGGSQRQVLCNYKY